MKKLKFHYEMELSFDMPVAEHHFVFRCLPMEDGAQRCYGLCYGIEPAGPVLEGRDGFGNRTCVGEAMAPHDGLKVWSGGWVFVDRGAGREEALHPMFSFPSSYTMPDQGLWQYFGRIGGRAKEGGQRPEGDLRMPMRMMDCLYQDFSYVPGKTSVATTAAQALAGGEGVCQDYAHIFLALCRMAGYPARYVAGMMEGEGATHAWTEVWDGGMWIGLDPTHNRLADDGYIKLSHGRDFGDCTVDKGCFKGFASQKQNIYVKVEESYG